MILTHEYGSYKSFSCSIIGDLYILPPASSNASCKINNKFRSTQFIFTLMLFISSFTIHFGKYCLSLS